VYTLYILQCKDGTLYTGVTTSVERRVAEHKAGTGARYTRARGVRRLVYTEECGTRSQALKRELAVKALSRREKLALAKRKNT
jgi:putative endonuclease